MLAGTPIEAFKIMSVEDARDDLMTQVLEKHESLYPNATIADIFVSSYNPQLPPSRGGSSDPVRYSMTVRTVSGVGANSIVDHEFAVADIFYEGGNPTYHHGFDLNHLVVVMDMMRGESV